MFERVFHERRLSNTFFLRTNDGEVLYYGGDWNFINRSGIIWSLLLAAM